jgi:hypothetical protein
MSDTPKTDDVLRTATIASDAGDSLPVLTAIIKHAKQLERENAILRDAITDAERELVRLFTVLPIKGHLPSPSVMQRCQAAQLPTQ